MNVWLLLVALQDTVTLKPVVVTANRIPVSADAVAAAVTVMRGTDLVAQGIRTVAEALREVPGVTIVETGSFGGQASLFLRGGESDYVKVLVDGVPLNLPGGGIDLADITTDNIDRIEVVRGPGSVLYGSDAMTGVVQIFTRGGQGTGRLGAELRAGTYGAVDAAVDVTGRNRGIGYAARVSRFSADGLYPYNNDYRNSVASARVQLTPDAGSDVSLSYRYGDDVYHFPTLGDGTPADSNQRSSERGPLFSLSAGRVLGSFEARLLATWREVRLLFNDEPDSPAQDGAFRSRDYVRRATTGGLLTWRTKDLTLTGGLEYEDERQRGRSEFSASFGTFPDSIAVLRFTTGYFTQAIIGTGEPIAITLGGRVDGNSQFGTHATYRGGLVYRVESDWRTRFSVGTGFKEPTFFENYARGFVTGNPNLKPERSLSWEAGLERSVAGQGTLAVTYFNQRFRDLVEFTGAPAPGQPNYFNIAGASASGLEAELTTSVINNVELSVRYTYLRTRVDRSADSSADALFVPGQPLLRRPTHTVFPHVFASLGRAHVSLGVRWIGERDDLDFRRPFGQRRVTFQPYAQVNGSAEYDFGRFVLSGRIENAFNDQTEETPGFRPRGRTVLVGGRVALGR
jgi:vitamin B12 transporter